MGKIEKTTSAAETGASERPFRMKIRLATRADAAELQAIYAHYVENTTVSFEYEAPSVAEMERRIAEVEGVYPFLVCVVEGENCENREGAECLPVDVRDLTAKIDKNGKIAKIRESAKSQEGVKSRESGKKRENGKVREDVKIGKGDGSGEVGERIVGYALAHRAFERAAYSWAAETAVYVDRKWRRRGIGEALYSALIAILEAQGVRTLYAVVVAENKASVEFHRRAGYREFATFKNSGWKFDRWLDVVWLERTLGVWRDEEKSGKAEASKTEGEGADRTANSAPSPVRPLAALEPERLANRCALRNVARP